MKNAHQLRVNAGKNSGDQPARLRPGRGYRPKLEVEGLSAGFSSRPLAADLNVVGGTLHAIPFMAQLFLHADLQGGFSISTHG